MFTPITTETRLSQVGTGLHGISETFQVLSQSLHTPFLAAISLAAAALASSVQAIRQNRRDCAELLEHTYVVLNALVPLYVNTDTRGELPPKILSSMGQFAETLHIVRNFVEAQQDTGRLRKIFRQGEMGSLLKHAKTGLQAALEAFQVNAVHSMHQLAQMENDTAEMHQSVLDFVAALSDGTDFDGRAPSLFNGSFASTRSLSLLPSKPKIFCGRESEINDILRFFASESSVPSTAPRIAILGPGGIGKTSLAKAVLHHAAIGLRYPKQVQRYFVACDAALTRADVAERVASNLGLKPSKNAGQLVVKKLASMTEGCLLVLDNLETAWEAMENRAEVEEFLGMLAGIEHVALMVTMRGAERPAGVQWSRPFLAPLSPLSQAAAREMFSDIADHSADENDEDLDKVLRLTDNVPLAINLLAHLVDSEGCATVLARWEKEKTLLVSDGYDRGSNLNYSIQLSLSSPRIAALPQASHLLALLALLPDGISDVELSLMQLPVDDVLRCRTALLRTALAYTTEHNRLKVLVPIQEYMLRFEPPPNSLVRAAMRYYQHLLELDSKYEGTTSSPAIVQRIQANVHNMQRVLAHELETVDAAEADDVEALEKIVEMIHILNNFSQVLLNVQQIPLFARVPELLERLGHPPRWELRYIAELFNSSPHVQLGMGDAKPMIEKAAAMLATGMVDPEMQCRYYAVLGNFLSASGSRDSAGAYKAYETGLALSIEHQQYTRQMTFLRRLAFQRSQDGKYDAARKLARDAQMLANVTGNIYREASALGVEALCCVALGDLAAAGEMYAHARMLYGLCGMTGSYADCSLAHDQAELFFAKSEYADAVRVVIDIQHHMSLPGELSTGISGALTLSIPVLDRAHALLVKVGYLDTAKECELVQAQILWTDGDPRAAYDVLIRALRPKWSGSVELRKRFVEKLSFLGSIGRVAVADTWPAVFLVESLQLKAKPGVYKALRDLGASLESHWVLF
ncbi:hypothetical protein MKEN_01341200 [Mycena kentingensis (nom. inval.)]|nr:hypothetical protein MKEN_01341200 [Mycena kentingensis (nom. inval.)]